MPELIRTVMAHEAADHLRAIAHRPQGAPAEIPTAGPAVTIRFARPGDEEALERLGRLDGDRATAAALLAGASDGAVLVAVVDGEILAARHVVGGLSAADPFSATTGIRALLDIRARQLLAPRPSRRFGIALHRGVAA